MRVEDPREVHQSSGNTAVLGQRYRGKNRKGGGGGAGGAGDVGQTQSLERKHRQTEGEKGRESLP